MMSQRKYGRGIYVSVRDLTIISENAQEGCIEESGDGIPGDDDPAISEGIQQLGSADALRPAFHSRCTPLPVVRVPSPTGGYTFCARLTTAVSHLDVS